MLAIVGFLVPVGHKFIPQVKGTFPLSS